MKAQILEYFFHNYSLLEYKSQAIGRENIYDFILLVPRIIPKNNRCSRIVVTVIKNIKAHVKTFSH